MENKPGHEQYAVVLDYLPNGYPFDTRPSHLKTSIVQALGKEHFVLLELVPKKDVPIQPHDEVYIGEGKRDQIHHINGRMPEAKLTRTARIEMEFAIDNIVKADEKRFVDFYNKAQPLSTRMHSLELLPGLGKKRMWEIIDERDVKPFDSFDDLKKRVKLMPDPIKTITRRILEEISGNQKHYLFVDNSTIVQQQSQE